MARLQILELPEGSGDERSPYLLIIDQVDDELAEDIARWPDDIGKRTGARHVLCFPGTIDIPANDTAAYLQQVAEETGATIGEAVRAANAQHSMDERTDITRDMYRLAKWKNELTHALGMDRTRDWDDIRNAAAGLRKQRDSQAETLERVRNLPEQPNVMDAQHPDPTGYLHGYSVAIREAKRATYPPAQTEASEARPAADA